MSLLHQENFDFLRGYFCEVLKLPGNHHKWTFFKIDQKRSQDMSLCPVCGNMKKKTKQKEVP